MKHFVEITDLSGPEIESLLDAAAKFKAAPRSATGPLAGKILGLVFEKPSLRTRASFESAMLRLGGTTLFFPAKDVGFGTRESYEDFSRVLSQYVDAFVLRVKEHSTIVTMARQATVPVINGLSESAHPCQALGDFLTIREAFGTLNGKTIAFVGDGNNVARSLARGCPLLGMKFVLARPDGYGFEGKIPADETTDPFVAVKNADVIYTDVWTSMGQEAERTERLTKFAPYQVNAKLLESAPAHVKVLHCMPAHRGEEITSEVLDGPRSLAVPQAANRMHAQAALLQMLMG